ncbi:hypothetical protein [Aliihoeflea sp. PC F10.4]
MNRETRNTMLATAAILIGFGGLSYFMPTIMLAAIEVSPWLAGAIAALFLLAFFGIFWLRGRMRR